VQKNAPRTGEKKKGIPARRMGGRTLKSSSYVGFLQERSGPCVLKGPSRSKIEIGPSLRVTKKRGAFGAVRGRGQGVSCTGKKGGKRVRGGLGKRGLEKRSSVKGQMGKNPAIVLICKTHLEEVRGICISQIALG